MGTANVVIYGDDNSFITELASVDVTPVENFIFKQTKSVRKFMY